MQFSIQQLVLTLSGQQGLATRTVHERYTLGQVVAIVAAAGFVVGGFIGYCGATLDKD